MPYDPMKSGKMNTNTIWNTNVLKKEIRATVESSGAKEMAEYLLKFYEKKKGEKDGNK